MSNRLATIVVRQRQSFFRDVAFAVVVAIAGAISLSTLDTAAHAAKPEAVSRGVVSP
jgi:hypothetical protein